MQFNCTTLFLQNTKAAGFAVWPGLALGIEHALGRVKAIER
jgi:hypothetical protein